MHGGAPSAMPLAGVVNVPEVGTDGRYMDSFLNGLRSTYVINSRG